MKKLLLSTVLLSAGIIAGNSQTLTFLDAEGNAIEDGATLDFKGFNISFGNVVDGYAEGWVQVRVDPELSVVSSEDDLISVRATSLNGQSYQLCAGGDCVFATPENPVITKKDIDIHENVPIPLQLEAILQFMNEEVVLPAYDIFVEAWSETEPSNKITLNLKMGSIDSGVEGILDAGSNVSVNGSVLSYDVADAATLSVYHVNGTTVLNEKVSGYGSFDLGEYAKGIYIYKLVGKGTKTGKFIIN